MVGFGRIVVFDIFMVLSKFAALIAEKKISIFFIPSMFFILSMFHDTTRV